MEAAYAAMAGVANSWISQPLVLNGKTIVHRYLRFVFAIVTIEPRLK